MRLDGKEDVEIAARSAAHPSFAFAGKPDAGAVLHPFRDVHRQGPFTRHPAGSIAAWAWRVDHLAAPLAGRTGPLDGEEALRRAHLADAAAGAAGRRRGACLGPRPSAGLARDGCRHADLRRLAFIGLGQRDLHIVAKVRAALARRALPWPALAHEFAEQVVEHRRHGGGEIGTEAVRVAAHATFERRVAE